MNDLSQSVNVHFKECCCCPIKSAALLQQTPPLNLELLPKTPPRRARPEAKEKQSARSCWLLATRSSRPACLGEKIKVEVDVITMRIIPQRECSRCGSSGTSGRFSSSCLTSPWCCSLQCEQSVQAGPEFLRGDPSRRVPSCH